jgi:hypothetical protein
MAAGAGEREGGMRANQGKAIVKALVAQQRIKWAERFVRAGGNAALIELEPVHVRQLETPLRARELRNSEVWMKAETDGYGRAGVCKDSGVEGQGVGIEYCRHFKPGGKWKDSDEIRLVPIETSQK